jgi:hypothetical protein
MVPWDSIILGSCPFFLGGGFLSTLYFDESCYKVKKNKFLGSFSDSSLNFGNLSIIGETLEALAFGWDCERDHLSLSLSLSVALVGWFGCLWMVENGGRHWVVLSIPWLGLKTGTHILDAEFRAVSVNDWLRSDVKSLKSNSVDWLSEMLFWWHCCGGIGAFFFFFFCGCCKS